MANFTVSATGFVASNGQPWTMRGLDAGVQDALQGFPGVLTDYPGLTAIRLNCDPSNDSAASIAQVVQEYTAKGVVVEIEDHSGNGDNVAWYQQMATAYKDNPLVFLETPNEPTAAAATTAQNQIGIINAIRAAGFTNPIGVQPNGGWDYANLSTVTAAVGTAGLFITPHIYYNGTDPNGAANYVQSDIQGAKALGVFASIDEFGNAMDGFTLDPYGNSVITSVVAANEAGQAGAVFWAMDNDNHPDGTDSAFLTRDGSQLTPIGKQLQSWLSQPTTPTGGGTTTGGGTITPLTPPLTPPAPPSPVTTGTGPDSLVLSISEDAYLGDAQFTVSVDGNQLGGTFTATGWHSAGQEQLFTFNGTFAAGNHSVTVDFLNDAYGGSAAADRNLYVDAISYDGTDTAQSAVLGKTGPKSFSVADTTVNPVTTPIPPPPPAPVTTGSGSDTLVLAISEDAYQGDAQFTVSIDGQQQGGTFTATALHNGGISQDFIFDGDWSAGTHAVVVNFLNDAYGGSTAADRNLYLNAISYDGTDTAQSAVLGKTGPKSFSVTDGTAILGAISIPTPPSPPPPITLPVPSFPAAPVTTGSGSDTLVLTMSEDAYQGDAQFTVSVDGKQLGGTFTTTASHASGFSQDFTFQGDWATGTHVVAVNFLNDVNGGSPSADRNLYVNGISYDGTATGQTAALSSTGPVSFPISDGATSSVGGQIFVLSSGDAATVTLGTGASRMAFIGAGSLTLVGGSGHATVFAAAASNKLVAGTGTLDVMGGGGKDAYVFHANSGLLKIEDFSIAKGDTLTIDKVLQGSLQQTSDGHGGTMLTFGAGAAHGVDIQGIATMPTTNILWA
jgi:hypothetical protein